MNTSAFSVRACDTSLVCLCVSLKSKIGLVKSRYFLWLARKRRLSVFSSQNKVKYESQCGSPYVGHFLYTVRTDVPLVLENNAQFRIEFYNIISLFKD